MPQLMRSDHRPDPDSRDRASETGPAGPAAYVRAVLRNVARFGPVALLVVGCATTQATPGIASPGSPVPASAASGSPSPASAAPSTTAQGSALPGPNAGHVLFGDAYDHATFVLAGRTSRAPQGRDVAFVAHFKRRVADGAVHVLVILGGRTLLDRAIPVTNGPWSVYGAKIPGSQLSEPGVLLVRFVDDASVLLSSGTLTVTPGPTGSPTGSPGDGSPSPS